MEVSIKEEYSVWGVPTYSWGCGPQECFGTYSLPTDAVNHIQDYRNIPDEFQDLKIKKRLVSKWVETYEEHS